MSMTVYMETGRYMLKSNEKLQYRLKLIDTLIDHLTLINYLNNIYFNKIKRSC